MPCIPSNLTLINGVTYLMVSVLVLVTKPHTHSSYMRSMEVLNFVVCAFTLRIIYIHSARSLGAYKYCLYQIVLLSLFSQQLTIFGPVFLQPILGGYQTIDVVDNPYVVHGVLCSWIVLSALDLASIHDGFLFRCRVLVKMFYPLFTNKMAWIGIVILTKSVTILLIGLWFLPIGSQLNRKDMREYLIRCYPNAVPTFDAYKSFIVYDVERLTGFVDVAIVMATGICLICAICVIAMVAIIVTVRLHKDQMSTATQKMHTRFVIQLGFQASVPFCILVCPLFSLLVLIVIDFPFQSNWPGYVALILLMVHGPLTSIMTIYLYEPYRKAVISYFRGRILHSVIDAISVTSAVFTQNRRL